MAAVTISTKQFREARVPAVCVVTGLPAAQVFRFQFSGVAGGLPLHGETARTIARLQSMARFLFLASVAGFLATIALRLTFLAVITGVLVVAALAVTAIVKQRVPTGSIVDETLTLTRVHEAFVSAMSHPPSKCSDCTGANTCSIVEMDACEGLAANV